jgi:hypothetical protein
MQRRAFALGTAIIAVAALAFGACGDGGDDGNGVTPTDTAIATETEPSTFVSIPTETPPRTVTGPDIRQEDLPARPEVVDFISTAGGEVDPNAILYADLTEDDIEDAVVPVSSGGEGGNIAVFVFGYVDGELHQLLQVTPESPPINAAIRDGQLSLEEPVFAEGDPMCCPSQIRTTTYRWSGSELVVDEQDTRDAP